MTPGLRDLLILVVAIENLAIAAGYVGIGAYVAPKFDAAATGLGLRLTKLSALVFFLTCAMTHTELAFHVFTDQPDWMISPHFIIVHGLQAVAAPAFLVLATAFMSIRIFNRTLYERVLARRIEEVRLDLEHRAKEARIERVRTETDDLTETVWGALGRGRTG